jgi:predicted phage terminase large subunit-like protein
MITGHSGILSISPPWFMPIYEPSKRRLSWPNGSQAFAFSAEEPDRLRGPQFHFAWGDEVAVWKYDEKTLAMLRFSLRLGKNPQAIYTTTPRPTTLMRQLLKDSPGRYISRGSTYDNKANLPAGYLQQIKEKYEGTRLGRQEIYAELLEDIPGALITPEHILHTDTTPSNITRTEVAIDPAVTNNPNSDSTGIIVAAKTSDNKVYILADYSMKASPEQWARRAIKAYHDFSCDRIIYEGNMGGDLVASTLRAVDNTVRIDKVTASKGKHIRFAPVAALYEQGKVFHVGQYADLEQQLCSFTLDGYCGDGSPDRADAAVYAITSLVLQKKKSHAAALY